MRRRRVGVLISGRGSNMAALIAAAAAPDYPAEIALVVSNVPGAAGLALAEGVGVSALCIDHKNFGRDRAAHEAAVVAALDAVEVELVCLAGWMRLLTPFMVRCYAGRMLNIHPSLLPAFPGLDTHTQALAAGVTLHGCTVHLVTEAMDRGPILAQAAVPVLPGDSAETLAARVLVQEHALYPAVLAQLAGGRALAACPADAALHNPLPNAAPGV
jgi:phosphoribosylglycinamide formyltransferase-1